MNMENAVEYHLYFSTLAQTDKAKHNESLEVYLAEVTARASTTISDYIWQNESFNLRVKDEQDEEPGHLYGSTDFGDNIDDEWFLVYLMFELSRWFPDLIASISDGDGEFMLIEAASFLPKWLEPETSTNRVFIHAGDVHIVPFPSTPGEVTMYPTGTPPISLALSTVCGKYKTQAAGVIQNAIKDRIKGYPSKAEESIHRTHCVIPASLSHVLTKKPSLIAPAVQAFYHRDPIDMKACRNMKYFPPESLIKSTVKFTRCLYAQLKQQEFHPDKRTNWTLPSTSQPDYQAHVLGMKLAHGFEILCSRVGKQQTVSQDQVTIEPSGTRWEMYLKCLKRQGYFKDEIDGSKLYKELLEKAKNISVNMYKITTDDTWLSISPQELVDMLSKYSTKHHKKNEQKNTAKEHDEDFDLDSVTYSMKSFVDKISSHEGAEFPWSADDPSIQFDASNFMDSIQKLLDQSVGDNDAQSGEDEEDSSDDLLGDSDEDQNESDDEENEMTAYMKEMDQELAGTSIAKTFERINLQEEKQDLDGNENTVNNGELEDDECYPPVNVDLNLVKNLLESYSSQQGLAGPASNILSSMGVSLPQNTDT